MAKHPILCSHEMDQSEFQWGYLTIQCLLSISKRIFTQKFLLPNPSHAPSELALLRGDPPKCMLIMLAPPKCMVAPEALSHFYLSSPPPSQTLEIFGNCGSSFACCNAYGHIWALSGQGHGCLHPQHERKLLTRNNHPRSSMTFECPPDIHVVKSLFRNL